MQKRNSWLISALMLIILLGLGWYFTQANRTIVDYASPTVSRTNPPSRSTNPTKTTSKPTKTLQLAQTDEFGLPYIEREELPPEALDTLQLIEQGGPFPYSKDGATFGNRERLLPRKSAGYYHEYTVETPGENDRGARRIITGNGGELYYTDDHYASFKRIR